MNARPLALLAVTALMSAAGCATRPEGPGRAAAPPPPPPPLPTGPLRAAPAWVAAVTEADYDRLRRLPAAWREALAEAREAGHAADLAALGPLADPAAALADPTPPPGVYRCRTIKLGSRGQNGGLAYVAYGWFQCVVSGDASTGLRLDKTTGSQRQQGRLYADDGRRLVFLGVTALGTDPGGPAYGADPERDVIGVLERVGQARWRVAQPWPGFESDLDLLELVPAG